MEVLYVSDFKFSFKSGGYLSTNAYPDSFWQKYLTVFSKIHIVGIENTGDTKGMTELKDKRINVSFLPKNSKPTQFLNDFKIRKELKKLIGEYEAIIIKPSSRKGMMAIKIAEQLHKPYMIEMTGDIESSLATHNHLLRRLYAPTFYRQVKKAIKNCEFGLYVTDSFLQAKYPIKGLQCGCTDTDLERVDDLVLKKRLLKIDRSNEPFKIGLIGTYSDNRKGLDIAIKALSRLSTRTELHILGNGSESDRQKWNNFAKKQDYKFLFFDGVLNGRELVFQWIDSFDVIILPSRSEGLPRCIIEAMSRGCPCITSDACGLPELIDKEFIHKTGDYCELSEKLTHLLTSKEILKQEATKNFNKAKKYVSKEQKIIRDAFLEKFKNYCEERVKIDEKSIN